MAWSVLSFVGLPICPPAVSWIVASTFTTMASLVLPVISTFPAIGVGSAHISTRIFVSLVEWAFAAVSVAWCPACLIDISCLCTQSILLMVYAFFSVVASFDPVDIYFEHVPLWAKGMQVEQFIFRNQAIASNIPEAKE